MLELLALFVSVLSGHRQTDNLNGISERINAGKDVAINYTHVLWCDSGVICLDPEAKVETFTDTAKTLCNLLRLFNTLNNLPGCLGIKGSPGLDLKTSSRGLLAALGAATASGARTCVHT